MVIFEKFDFLSNQQETFFKKGSSETYTQSLSYFFNTVDSANNRNPDNFLMHPKHIKFYSNDFIDWFVGFSEGDGSFIRWKSNKISFAITQKDAKVLYFIKKNLGFGTVYLCKDGYYRYIVSNQKNLLYLINIFNQGNLILFKTYKRFKEWLSSYSLYYRLEPIAIVPQKNFISFSNAWLSGFIDAEGCFNAVKRAGRTTYRMRFSLKQKAEFNVFQQFKGLWGSIKIDILLKNDVVILSLDTLKSLEILIQYLTKYPLRSNKNISFSRWLRLFRVIKDGGRGKSYEEIKEMAQNINKFGSEDKVQN